MVAFELSNLCNPDARIAQAAFAAVFSWLAYKSFVTSKTSAVDSTTTYITLSASIDKAEEMLGLFQDQKGFQLCPEFFTKRLCGAE
jgi:hypothetical protein